MCVAAFDGGWYKVYMVFKQGIAMTVDGSADHRWSKSIRLNETISQKYIIEHENKIQLAEADRVYWQKNNEQMYGPSSLAFLRINDAVRQQEIDTRDQLYENFYQLFIDMPMVMQGAPYHPWEP